MTTTVLDQIKRNALPAAVMRTASKGALPLPAGEMIEILVYLTQNPVFSQDARMTLAGWDIESAKEIVKSSSAPPEVLGYFWAEKNRRPSLMPALIENPAIDDNLLMELAGTGSREVVSMLLASPRVRTSPGVMEGLATNPHVTPDEARELKGEQSSASETPAETDAAESDLVHVAWQQEHLAEIAAEEGKAFELTGAEEEQAVAELTHSTGDGVEGSEQVTEQPALQAIPETLAVTALGGQRKTATAPPSVDDKKLSVIQKLARMSASERVKAAFLGGREERSILIRDGARVIQNAVLASPKLTDSEVETFASAKNVQENVLREIARNRRFMKHYTVMRNLVVNPKTPLDVALPLVKMLMIYDLKGLQHNKNVSDTIRKVAQKYYKEKATSGGKTRD